MGFFGPKNTKKCTFWLILDQNQRFLAKNIPFDVRIEKIEICLNHKLIQQSFILNGAIIVTVYN